MKALIVITLLTLLTTTGFTQEKLESDIDYAYQNAKKGIYWALSNIPKKKTKLDRDLIADDRLYAHVRLNKEVNGVKIVSTGHYQTNKVIISIYRSNDSLKEYGYLEQTDENWKHYFFAGTISSPLYCALIKEFIINRKELMLVIYYIRKVIKVIQLWESDE